MRSSRAQHEHHEELHSRHSCWQLLTDRQTDRQTDSLFLTAVLYNRGAGIVPPEGIARAPGAQWLTRVCSPGGEPTEGVRFQHPLSRWQACT